MKKSKEILDLKNKLEASTIAQEKKYKEEVKNLEEKQYLELLKIRDIYIKEKQGRNYNKCIKLEKKRILLIIFSFFHFLHMLEIHGILFALMREIKRSIYFKIKEKYPEHDTKTFYDYLSTSSINDSSKINFNYFTSFLSSYFISKLNIAGNYIFSILANIIVILLLLINDF